MKERIHEYLIETIRSRVQESQDSVASTQASRDSDTKSTAGDKHEVGRAMAQIELENQQAQLQRNLELMEQLESIHLNRSTEQIGKGSLVKTDVGIYYISIGMGAVEVDGETIFVISPASPIGQLMIGKSVSEEVLFNGRAIQIKEIH